MAGGVSGAYAFTADYGDVIFSGSNNDYFVGNDIWDLNKGSLTISYSIDWDYPVTTAYPNLYAAVGIQDGGNWADRRAYMSSTINRNAYQNIFGVYNNSTRSTYSAWPHSAVTSKKYDIDLESSYAYGDTAGDYTMFKKVRYPYCMNPTKELLQKVIKDRSLIDKINVIVERKDVIYKITADVKVM